MVACEFEPPTTTVGWPRHGCWWSIAGIRQGILVLLTPTQDLRTSCEIVCVMHGQGLVSNVVVISESIPAKELFENLHHRPQSCHVAL